MESFTEEFRVFAREKRADLLGIAPIERFDGVAPEHHPSSIFPEVRSVIVAGKRIPRGALRGVEEGTQMDIYGQYGLSWLKDRVLAMTTITLATWIEDHHWEAVPIQDLPPQIPPSGVQVRPDLPPPNVMIDVKDAAVRAGLGEIGFCRELLTPQFGPRQRLQLILTDAELTPTPLWAEPICDQCMLCAETCPLDAMDRATPETLDICGKSMIVGRIDTAKCRQCRNGARPSPASHPAAPPDRLAALCMRTCLDHLERTGRIQNRFAGEFRKRPAWQSDIVGRTSLRDQ